MKTKFFISVLIFLGFVAICNAQDYSKLKDIELKDKEDFTKVEDKVLECSTYILTTPMDDENTNRINALQFLFRWMDGTPDYTFSSMKPWASWHRRVMRCWACTWPVCAGLCLKIKIKPKTITR